MNQNKPTKAQTAAAFLTALLMAVAIAVLLFSNHVLDEPESNDTRVLPSDLCMIDGKPLMPEMDYKDHGNAADRGVLLKYVNLDGDLVMATSKEIIAIYEGDFCHE